MIMNMKCVGYILVIIALGFSSCGRNRTEPTATQTYYTAIPINSLNTIETFEGTVVSKYMGMENDATNILILLLTLKKDGQIFAITSRDATQSQIAFVNSLETNRSYLFPDIYLQWCKKQDPSQDRN